MWIYACAMKYKVENFIKISFHDEFATWICQPKTVYIVWVQYYNLFSYVGCMKSSISSIDIVSEPHSNVYPLKSLLEADSCLNDPMMGNFLQ